MKTIEILDQTLREGCQSPGIQFSLHQKREIISSLLESGIKFIEIGLVGINLYDDNFMKEIVSNYQNNHFFVSSLLSEMHYKIIKDISPVNWLLIVPTSRTLIENKFGLTIQDYLYFIDNQFQSIDQTKIENRPFVVLEDASRTPFDQLNEIIKHLYTKGCNGFFYSDTVGCDVPNYVTKKVNAIKMEYPNIKLGVHFHNDTGMALANTIAAQTAGVDIATATVNGLGDRVGICNLLQLVYYLNNQYDIEKIIKLSKYVARETLTPINPNTPIVGENLFLCETGLHVAALLKDKESYNSLNKLLKDDDIVVLLGKNSGRSSLRHYLKVSKLDINYSEDLYKAFKMYFYDKSCKTLQESMIAFNEFILEYKNYGTKDKYEYFSFLIEEFKDVLPVIIQGEKNAWKSLITYNLTILKSLYNNGVLKKDVSIGYKHIFNPLTGKTIDYGIDKGVFFFTGVKCPSDEEFANHIISHRDMYSFLKQHKKIDVNFSFRDLNYKYFKKPLIISVEQKGDTYVVDIKNHILQITIPSKSDANANITYNGRAITEKSDTKVDVTNNNDVASEAGKYLDKYLDIIKKSEPAPLEQNKNDDNEIIDNIDKLKKLLQGKLEEKYLELDVVKKDFKEDISLFYEHIAYVCYSLYQSKFEWKQYILYPSSTISQINNSSYTIFYKKVIDEKVIFQVQDALNLELATISTHFHQQLLLRSNMKSAVAAIMSRQTSHNLGSHVIPGTISDIRKGAALSDKDKEGLARLYQYIQERMDFISMIVNTDKKNKLKGCLNLKAHILDELAMDGPGIRHAGTDKCTNYILRHIVKSEDIYRFETVSDEKKFQKDGDYNSCLPIELQIIKKIGKEYKAFTSVSNGETNSNDFSNIEFSVPYGVNGRHAFLNILEDFIRNTAKHNRVALSGLDDLTFSILVQEKQDLAVKKGETNPIKDDELLVTIYSNKESDNDELKKIIEQFNDLKLLDADGSINQERKGLKEILICLAWLKDKMEDLSIIEKQIEEKKEGDNTRRGFRELNAPICLCQYTLVKDVLNNANDNKEHLALRFILPKYRFLYVIRDKDISDNNSELDFDKIFDLPASELYFINADDNFYTKNADNGSKFNQLKKAIPRLIGKTNTFNKDTFLSIIKSDKDQEKGDDTELINKRNNVSAPYSTEQKIPLYREYLIQNHFIGDDDNKSLPELVILNENKSGDKKNQEFKKVIRDEDNLDIAKNILNERKDIILFKRHNDNPAQYSTSYKALLENGKLPLYIEGISGGNFTYNLVVSNTINELEYYKILESSLTKIAIIDERIFEHSGGKKPLSKDQNDNSAVSKVDNKEDELKKKFVELINDTEVLDSELEEFVEFNNLGYSASDIRELIVASSTKTVHISDLPAIDIKPTINGNMLQSKHIFIYNFNNKTLFDTNNKQCDQINFNDFHFISVHLGIIEKYKAKVEIETRLKDFKKEILKLDDNNCKTKLLLHSGRGYLTNLQDQITYLPVSSIEAQLNNCKYLLVQQFANMKFKPQSINKKSK